jgi:hypothetical protein
MGRAGDFNRYDSQEAQQRHGQGASELEAYGESAHVTAPRFDHLK